jgi:uncharacterized protein YprB with RNaseH-like and TPR domain
MSGATLERRLANYRAALRTTASGQPASAARPGDRGEAPSARGSIALGERLAAALDGELVLDPARPVVRCEPATVVLPLDRERLHGLPGQAPVDAPLVCLDTETTGLATAAGTVAFLVGLGWWEGDRFRQVQLLLPDHPAEPGLLARLAAHIPANAWLVTYNGRGFDWPLLVARYRMARQDPPPLGGHLDLLPFVRRVFRHRMTDARLRTVETELLGTVRHGDVDGWQIPGLYLDFLRGGEAWPLVDVLRHNREDVRSLARLLSKMDVEYADPVVRAAAPAGDLAGLARAFARERRLDEALSCLDGALARDPRRAQRPGVPAHAVSEVTEDLTDEWWSPKRPPDIGGRPRRASWATLGGGRLESPWTEERIVIERARLLRRLGRHNDAVGCWLGLATGPGSVAIQAWIEVAKLREHRLSDLPGALDATVRAATLAERRRRMGMGDPALEGAIAARLARLRRRVDQSRAATPEAIDVTSGSRGSGSMSSQVARTQSRSGSNEQAIVRRSPASALR